MFSLQSFSLEGRRALVTGGATGIGAAIAEGLAACGADVAITVHSRPAADALAAIRGHGRVGGTIETDLGTLTPEAAGELIETAEARLGGGIDILINNAGIIRRAEALDYSYDDWRAVLSVNLDTVWLLSQAAARPMAKRGQGKIVAIASLLGFQGGILIPAYTAAKHAVVGLTRALANEWAAKGINVNAIAPGYVATENNRALREDPVRSAALLARIPAGRYAEPEEMAGAAVYLCSDAASYVNGSVISVDGGWLSR